MCTIGRSQPIGLVNRLRGDVTPLEREDRVRAMICAGMGCAVLPEFVPLLLDPR